MSVKKRLSQDSPAKNSQNNVQKGALIGSLKTIFNAPSYNINTCFIVQAAIADPFAAAFIHYIIYPSELYNLFLIIHIILYNVW